MAAALLLPSGLLAADLAALAKAIEKQMAHYRRHLPALDLTPFNLDGLLARAKEPMPSDPDALRREITGAAFKMHRAAKVRVLAKIRSEFESVKGGTPTREEDYERRRQVILTYDYVERAFGKSPIYPRNLGRPFVALVEYPAARHLALVDGFLEHLSKVPDPPGVDGGGTGGAGGTGGSGGGPGEADGGETDGGGATGGFTPDFSSPGPRQGGPLTVPVDDDTPQSHGGWALVRTYIFATLGAIFLVYIAYLAYSAAKGGKNALSFLVNAIRQGTGGAVVGPEEEPFRKAVRLFGRGKLDEALALLEPLLEADGPEQAPARFYALRCYLKQGKMGRVSRELPRLDLDKFSPDELYLLGSNLLEAEERAGALVIFRWLNDKDATFKDVAQKVEALSGGS